MIQMLLPQPRGPRQRTRRRPDRQTLQLGVTREGKAQRMREPTARGEDSDAFFE